MPAVKLQLEDKILSELEKLAEEIGMKVTTYSVMVLGQHVKQVLDDRKAK